MVHQVGMQVIRIVSPRPMETPIPMVDQLETLMLRNCPSLKDSMRLPCKTRLLTAMFPLGEHGQTVRPSVIADPCKLFSTILKQMTHDSCDLGREPEGTCIWKEALIVHMSYGKLNPVEEMRQIALHRGGHRTTKHHR